MTALIAGLVLFLGLHSTRMVADGARSRFIEQRGIKLWRALYTVVSLAGFALIIWGYSLTLKRPIVLRDPWPWERELAGAIMLASFVFLVAAYVPRNHFRAWVGHPMVFGTGLWALAHLVCTRTAADVLLFGGFLIWAVWCFVSLRARDRAAGVQRPPGQAAQSAIAVVIGAALWAAFAFWLHARLIGIGTFV